MKGQYKMESRQSIGLIIWFMEIDWKIDEFSIYNTYSKPYKLGYSAIPTHYADILGTQMFHATAMNIMLNPTSSDLCLQIEEYYYAACWNS